MSLYLERLTIAPPGTTTSSIPLNVDSSKPTTSSASSTQVVRNDNDRQYRRRTVTAIDMSAAIGSNSRKYPIPRFAKNHKMCKANKPMGDIFSAASPRVVIGSRAAPVMRNAMIHPHPKISVPIRIASTPYREGSKSGFFMTSMKNWRSLLPGRRLSRILSASSVQFFIFRGTDESGLQRTMKSRAVCPLLLFAVMSSTNRQNLRAVKTR
mmetsp:Transcript_14377/g.24447  ORF Transcript_14377/g.24447 Transcript_14377/m.24447 type:complete len:210 (-) Transcript_14377:216-845(-)